MKPYRWKHVLGICTAAVLGLSFPAYAVTITPLNPGTGQSSSSEPSGTGAPASQENTERSNIVQPVVSSEGAVLMDGASGKVLFSKNGNTRYYPASITKLMTALLVAENCSLDDKVTFSASATTNLESGAVSIGMVEGDTMTVRQCLYALLLKSANEVGNALAEHVSGSVQAFADRMNEKAAKLGCTNTHFTNPHGLNDPEHYTTPKDMALIARAAFQNEVVKTVASTRTYSLPATKKNPSGLTVTMGHKMLNPNDSRYYEGVIGGKTGYTSKAGNTLVTAAERDGVRMIAVVMKSRSTHYVDTKTMLDYGFELAEAGTLGTNQTGGQNAGSSLIGAGSEDPGAGAGPSGTAGAPGSAGSSGNSSAPGGTGSSGTGSAPGSVSLSGNSSAPGSTGSSGTTIVPGNTSAPQSSGNTGVSAGAPGSSGSPAIGTEGGPGVSSQRGWAKTEKGWNFVKDNGAKACGEWVSDAEGTYWIDEDTFMAKGWRQIDGKWYYLRSNGAMAKNYWEESQDGVWYYLGADGVMMTNTTTPDGYRVGADGAWTR